MGIGGLALLHLAEATAAGEEFEHNGVLYRHADFRNGSGNVRQPTRGRCHIENVETGERIYQTGAEENAFWSWAIIETLRHTGIRVEELVEITQLALVSSRLVDTGELVPLLQIVPSKSNEERLLLVSPELASVLSTIISRLRDLNGGSIPLTSRYDVHGRVTGPALPHVFQWRVAWRWEVPASRRPR